MSTATVTMCAPHEEIVVTRRARGCSVRRYYDPATGQFISVDPLVDQTEAPYAYAADDPVDASDPSGLLSLCGFGYCVSTHSFDPMASVDAIVNFGRGASFGLSDTIANWIVPGASCTIPENSFDQFLGGSATALLGGEALAALGRSTGFGDLLFNSRFFGADSRLFGSRGLGQFLERGGLLNPPGKGLWWIGWSVKNFDGEFGPVFRIKTLGRYWDLFEASRFP